MVALVSKSFCFGRPGLSLPNVLSKRKQAAGRFGNYYHRRRDDGPVVSRDEIDPAYGDVAGAALAGVPGATATLECGGKSFCVQQVREEYREAI